jgi:hypothetical protein
VKTWLTRTRVNGRILKGVAWATFAIAIVGIGVLVLAACDLGIKPLFGLRYCRASAIDLELAAEREKGRYLRDRLHQAQLRIAQLPPCTQGAAPAPPVEQRPAEPQQSAGIPAEPPKPEPPKVEEELKLPARIEDLQGCWQSVRGDISIVTDDDEQRLIGKVRICYCFGSNGRGTGRWAYADGPKCQVDLTARLRSHELKIRHGRVPCRDRSIVPEEITCTAQADGTASCDTQSLGRNRVLVGGEKYRRVSEAYCASGASEGNR